MQRYNEVKNYLHLHAYDATLNKDYLRTVPHMVKGPYAVCCCAGLIVVTNEMLEEWHISKFQLFNDAMRNMQEENPPILINIEEAMLSEGIDNVHNLLEYDFFIYDKNDIMFFVLTGKERVFGASYIIDDKLMKKVADKLDASFFVIPSSIHELIFVPDQGNTTVNELSEMVYVVNRDENIVSSNEKLSDTVAYYDRKLQMLLDPQAKVRQPSKKSGIPPRL